MARVYSGFLAGKVSSGFRFFVAALLVATLFAFLAGCTDNETVPPAVVTNLTGAHNAFGFKMLSQALKADSGKNVFISPTSISLALSMAYSGSGGETKSAMAKTLEIQGLNATDINPASRQLVSQLTSSHDIELDIANSIWVNNDLKLNSAYKDDMETYYGAQASTLNFADPKAADTINAWVKDKTKNKIDSIVNPPIDSSTKAILVNAVYFKGKWTVPFNKSSTTDRNFTASDSSESLVPMMQRGAKFSYLENSQFQAVRLPYGNDSASMYVFLPASSVLGMPKIDDFAASITQAQWQSWLPQFRETEGTVVLPKFKVEYMTSLAEALKNSGMGIAFSDAANFSGISKMPLEITDVVHKTYIETNEEGTEAAAVTGIFMGTTAVMPQQPPFYMEMNRPFFYAITDDKTGEIIFLGVMNKVDAQ